MRQYGLRRYTIIYLTSLNFDKPWNCLEQHFLSALAHHQQAADELGGDHFSKAGEEGFGGSAEKVLVAMEID